MEELWIGDLLRSLKSGRVGKYEGDKDGKARVLIEDKIYLIPFSRLEKLSEEEAAEYRLEQLKEPKVKKKKINDSGDNSPVSDQTNSLDLHIDKLAPHLEGKQPELIIIRQVEAAKAFIEKAIKKRQYSIILIHGKGSGALKMEIDHLLKNYKEVHFTKEVNNGGGTEVYFRYA